MNRRRWLGLGALALAFGGFGAWTASRRFSVGAADTAAVELLHGLTLPDSEGRPQALSALRGAPVLVNFWATWCAPCIEEMPELNAMHDEYAPRGLRIVGIGIDSAANIRQFSQKMPMRYPLLVAGGSGIELARRFGNTAGALPYTIVIDRRSQIILRKLGRFDNETLRIAVAQAL